MFRPLVRVVPLLGLIATLVAAGAATAAPTGVVQEDRIIAGGPKNSLEVRHLVLKGTNVEIGRALAEIAKERYGVRLDRVRDPVLARAQRRFLERNDPILLERMRGVAEAFGGSIDDEDYDYTALGFTDLKAGCSIAHLPPSSTANGKSVVSRDYDFTTGGLDYKFLRPGMMHPTARPYLLELHPDHGYASIAMVAYDLLSGVLDGINSEGLTVTIALDDEIFNKDPIEPTRDPAVGLGELQTVRLLLDTCASVEEAKEALMATKQYYQYVPIHYLIADRFGNAFVWEYSQSHNKEYIVENPGHPLVMTNYTLHEHLENGLPPSADKARPVCKRYAYLTEKLVAGNLDDRTIREFHEKCDAQASQAADTTKPPERTFWHAFYYPEDRRVRLSYYLGEEPYPGQPRLVRPIRSDYLEFRLAPTESGSEKAHARVAAAPPPSNAQSVAHVSPPTPPRGTSRARNAAPEPATPRTSAPVSIVPSPPASSTAPAATASPRTPAELRAALEAAGGVVKMQGNRITTVGLMKATSLGSVLPLLGQLQDLEELNLGNPALTDAGVHAIERLPKLESLGLMGAPIGDSAVEILKTLPALRILNVSETKITDAGLAQIATFTRLEYLGLKGTGVTDAGLARLKTLTALETLILADTKVTDAGLVHVAALPRLESVNLSNDAVTDAGLEQLCRSSTLAGINLTGTKVTDAGLAHLKQLPRLSKLNVTGTAVTEEGAKQAKKFLPFWATVTR